MGSSSSHESVENLKINLGVTKWENIRVKTENERIKKEKEMLEQQNRAIELQRTQDAVKQLQENQKVQEEKDRMREENRRMQEENRNIKEEMRRQEERQQEKQRIDEMARKIEEEARGRVEKEVYLRKQAEENWEKGVPAVKYPSGPELKAARERHKYQDGNVHFAITGVSGSGKSSLINAFRGYHNNQKGAAKSGTTETTEVITRYPDPHQDLMYWYDVPGAGTLKVPDWQYFNDQGLYIFDVIIIAIDIRFTRIDVALLLNCKRFNIPTFVVRSKANQHIYNTMNDDYGGYYEDEECDSNCNDCGDSGVSSGNDNQNDDPNDNSIQKRYERARDTFVTGTRKEFDSILKSAELPPQKVYIVSKEALCCFIKGTKLPIDMIDEMELVRDVFSAVNERRRSQVRSQ